MTKKITSVYKNGEEYLVEGKQGPEGKQGKQGDSVIVGEGDLPLAHVLGGDNTKAISQKGVTDQLALFETSSAGTTVSNIDVSISDGTGTVSASSSISQWHKAKYIQVNAGDIYRVNYKDGSTSGTRYCHIVLLSAVPANDGTGSVLDSHNTMPTPCSEQSYDFYCASSGYLTVFYQTASGSNKVSISFSKAVTLKERSQEIVNDIAPIKVMADGKKTITAWTSGSRMRYVKGGSTSTPKIESHTGYKRSGMIQVSKGDVVTVEGVTATNSCIIAYSATNDTTALKQRRWASSPYTDARFVWEVTANGYVMVCGSTDSTCTIELADAFIRNKDIKDLLSSGLPAYWQEYLSDKEPVLKADVSAADTEAFIFITDTHPAENNNKSAKVVGHIINNTPICKTIFGGDIGSTGTATASFQDKMVKEMKKQEAIANAARENGKYYAVRGNHDLNEAYGGIQYKATAAQTAAYVKAQSENYDVVFADDDQGCYYYTDNSESGIRFIFIDSVCGSTNGHLRLSKKQLSWIIATIAASPYDVVIIGHCPATPWFATSNESHNDWFENLRDVMLAANSRGSGSLKYKSQDGSSDPDYTNEYDVPYDFTDWHNYVIMYLNGHNHCDNQTYHNGVPFVTTMCDKADQHRYSPFCEDTTIGVDNKPTNVPGEQAFDVVSIPANHQTIVMRRIGFGFDRIFHVGTINLAVGGTETLSPTIDAASWTASNCNVGQVVVSGNAGTWPYESTIVSVEDGVVTAVAAGQAFVFAEDEDNNKEFWAIKVATS